MTTQSILIIKHGALGDVILATGPFAAIRAHHPQAHITLLTTAPYAKLLADATYFDEIITDTRPKIWNLSGWRKLILLFRMRRWDWVYDLQTSRRSSLYCRLFARNGTNWSGIAPNATHRHNTPQRTRLHTIDRQKEQLAIAGITDVPPPDVGWLRGNPVEFATSVASPTVVIPAKAGIHTERHGRGITDATAVYGADAPSMDPGLRRDDGLNALPPYALLIPGGSAHRPEKRWPATHYAELAQWLLGQNITPVLIGGSAETEVLAQIEQAAPGTINLCGKTDFRQIADLARSATCAVGNDTGPMHIIAAAGCPATVLFSAASNPDLCAPRGPHVTILRKPTLSDLSVAEIITQLPKQPLDSARAASHATLP